MSKKLLIITFAISLVLIGVFTYLIISHNKTDGQKLQEQQNITIQASNITLQIDEKDKKLNYQIKNPSNLEYEKTIVVSGDGIKLDGDTIIPQKIGNWFVTIFVNYNNITVNKVVTVTVKSPNFLATLQILDNNKNEVEDLFFNDTYFLKITLSTLVEFDLTSTCVANLNKVSENNNVLLYSFCCIKPEVLTKTVQTTFTVKYYDKTYSVSKNTYNHQTNFDVSFSNSQTKDEINLYKFDNFHTNLANADGFYSNATFQVKSSYLCKNLYKCEITNSSVAKLENETIVAVNDGQCEFNIISLDGSNYVKTYKVVVQTVKIDNFSKIEDVTINVGEEHNIEYKFFPIYAINSIELYVDDTKIENQNTKLCFNQAGEHFVKIWDKISNKQICYTLTVNDYLFEVEFLQSFMLENNAKFENNTLYVCIEQEIYIPFSYQIAPENLLSSIECEITFSQINGITISVEYYESNGVVLKVSGNGSVKVNFVSKENKAVTYSFNIVLSVTV